MNYVAAKLGLSGNSMESTAKSTNKYLMRRAFEDNSDPSPKSILVHSIKDLEGTELNYPVIVKPLDRSGSRGISKVMCREELETAILAAREQGFIDNALVEEFVTGQEYSVEYISFRGEHHFLAITKKYTTGTPHFIETGHAEPADLDPATLLRVKQVVSHALDSLEITDSASHSEIKISPEGDIKIIEIGGRMGGDFIGSDLVRLSSGVDFVRAVIQVATGNEPDLCPVCNPGFAGVRFIISDEDLSVYKTVMKYDPDLIVSSEIREITGEVNDSSERFGYFLMRADTKDAIERYLPLDGKD